MNVIAIKAGPESDPGIVSLLLEPFLDGLRESGAGVEVLTPGDGLRHMAGPAEVIVLASPLFFDGRTGPEGATSSLRLLLGRLTPGTCAFAGSPCGQVACPGRVVIASGCGFWEIDGLSMVPELIEALCNGTFPGFASGVAGAPRTVLLGAMPRGLIDWDVIGAAREAGYELAQEETGPLTAHDLARREAVTRDFHQQIVRGSSPVPAVSLSRETCAQKED